MSFFCSMIMIPTVAFCRIGLGVMMDGWMDGMR